MAKQETKSKWDAKHELTNEEKVEVLELLRRRAKASSQVAETGRRAERSC